MAREKKAVDSDGRIDQVATMIRHGYMPAVEVANKLGVSLTTVGRWADQSAVEAETIGGRRYVKISSLLEYIGPTQAQIFGFNESAPSGKKKASR